MRRSGNRRCIPPPAASRRAGRIAGKKAAMTATSGELPANPPGEGGNSPVRDVHRFDVFGRIYDLRREAGSWRALAVGSGGMLAPAGFVVPAFIEEEELEQFLFDLFHQSATLTNGDVRRLPPRGRTP